MEIVAPHANVIVPEVLESNNYKRWSIFMWHYLVGQDLWDVVQLSQLLAGGNMREWIKKSALALHAIKISCGEEMFDKIKDMDSAKEVWDALANMHKPPVVSQEIAEHSLQRRTDTFTAQAFGNLGRSQHEALTNAISKGDIWEVLEIIHENPGAASARIFENGFTALHFSVYKSKERIADYLISKVSKEELETIKDDFGNTALSIAARFGVGKSIAKKLVGKNSKLLTIQDNDGKIPVQLACSTIHEDMARYLYVATPLKFLNGDYGFYILQECIIRKIFDIAFDLLHHYTELASPTSCPSGSDPLILTLAKTPPPFLEGSNLPFWEHWIYDCIRVKANPIKDDEHRSCKQKIQDFYQLCKEKIRCYLFRICRVPRQIRDYCSVTTLVHSCDRDRLRRALKRLVILFVAGLRIFICIFLGIVFVMPATMMLLMPFILGVLIMGAPIILVSMLSRLVSMLSRLVSMLSWYFARELYQLKLMDEYARKVITLIRYQSLPEYHEQQFEQSKVVEAAFQAVKNGIPDIVKEITKVNGNILRSEDPEDSKNIFACAVAHRQEKVARFLYELAKEDTNMVTTIDRHGNNVLHLAAKLAPPYQLDCISGSALQLQSELRWFKGVEDIVPRSYREHKNKNWETPLEVFDIEHKDLLKEAEEWVKKTAESSTVVGALIITITFAVAFTVPGGLDQSTGFPIFLHKTPVPFMVFMVSDAISLFAASSSVIMFLGILTSRFAYKDFHKSLPIRLVMGLSSLFISIATMTMAFCAAVVIMLEGRLWVVIPITLFAGIPVTCFVVLQFPLLVEICVSTSSPNIFDREVSSWTRIMTEMVGRLRTIVKGKLDRIVLCVMCSFMCIADFYTAML